MTLTLTALAIAAITAGFLHTLAGPDHYVPFLVLARSRKWSMPRTLVITTLCGLGHVASSVLIGLVGIALGFALQESGSLEAIYETLPEWMQTAEGVRGGIAAWLMIGFGLAYLVWGLWRAIRRRPHTHVHLHPDGRHVHEHTHEAGHAHPHDAAAGADQSTGKRALPWVLFLIFVFGPCEPLIPLVVASAAVGPMTVVIVTALFAGATLVAMLAAVVAGVLGLKVVPTRFFERYSHAFAGAAICFCGVGIVFLGL
jgi:ABC-type nickel/cobalt efflux system permease component RcnA